MLASISPLFLKRLNSGIDIKELMMVHSHGHKLSYNQVGLRFNLAAHVLSASTTVCADEPFSSRPYSSLRCKVLEIT
jgi:hypothetical protein